MLHKTLILSLMLPACVFAQPYTSDADRSKALQERMNKAYGTGAASPPAASARNQSIGKTLMSPAMNTLQGQTEGDDAQKERRRILKGLGYDPDGAAIFVFVSHSMQKEVIRSYAREAIWAGATLVVRGIPNEMNLQQYLTAVSADYLGNKGNTASLVIDPRLFDRFGITRVPTIVIDEAPFVEPACSFDETVPRVDDRGIMRNIKACVAADPSSYYKLTGQVTIDYALEQFADAGSAKALSHLNTLREYNVRPGRDQVAFDGDWDSLDTPEQELERQNVIERADDISKRIMESLGPIFEEEAQ